MFRYNNKDNHMKSVFVGNWYAAKQREELFENQEETREQQILIKLLQYVLKNRNVPIDNNTTNPQKSDDHLNDIVDLVGKKSSKDILKKMLDKLSNNIDTKQHPQELKLQILNSQCSLDDEKMSNQNNLMIKMKKNEREQITVTGEKNARLICIKSDEQLPFVKSSKQLKEINDKTNKNEIKVKDWKNEKQNKHRKLKKSSKPPNQHPPQLHRLKKEQLPRRQLPPLDKCQVINAIQYKFDFYQYSRMKSIYKKSTSCDPLSLMNKISEQILDQCFLTVAREIELNDVIEKIYQSELQLD